MNNKRRMRTALLYAVAVVIQGPVSAGAVYKWVDDEGKVHYSATPPPAAEVKKMDVESAPERERDERRSPDTRSSDAYSRQKKVIYPGPQCTKARDNMNDGIREWLALAERRLQSGEAPERNKAAIAKFKEAQDRLNRDLSGCAQKYERSEEYKRMIDCLATAAPAGFVFCSPKYH